MRGFKDVFDHKVRLMAVLACSMRDRVMKEYTIWAANHLLAQRVRLENQKGTITQQAREIHDLQKEVRRLENKVDDLRNVIDDCIDGEPD